MFPDGLGWFSGQCGSRRMCPERSPRLLRHRAARSFFTPSESKPRPGGPKVVFQYTNEPPGECLGADLRLVDREAEIEGLPPGVRPELAAMTAIAGREPDFGWGIIYSYG